MRSRHAGTAARVGALALLLAAIFSAAMPGRAPAASTAAKRERVEISAPILPKVLVLYAAEGDKFPATKDAQVALAHDAALTYDFLLKQCATKYPGLVIPGPGAPPTTPAQNASNFEIIATCSYQEYTAKPYWVPALVDKVDICGNELGAGWHLPTEEEVVHLTASDRRQVARALATPNASTYFGNFYFGLTVWVRGADGALRMGDLSPGADGSGSVTDLPVSPGSKVHLEAGLALRCFRRTTVDGSNGAGGAGGAAGAAGAGGRGGAGGDSGPGGTAGGR